MTQTDNAPQATDITEQADAIDAIIDAQDALPLRAIRDLRPDVARYTRGSYHVLLEPQEPGSVSRFERELIAFRVALLSYSVELTEYHRVRLRELGTPEATITAIEQFPKGEALPERETLILGHVERLIIAPHTASRESIETLLAGGFSPRDIVSIAQLITFASYEVRVLAGLKAIAGDRPEAQSEPLPQPLPHTGFTVDAVEWAAWLETVDPAAITPEQLAVLEESTPTAKTSPYYLLLIHDTDALRQRSRLFKTVMYAPHGARRADRELASVATSRINGCVYCASVHSRLYNQLSKKPEVIDRIFEDGVHAELGEHERAVVDYAVKLTQAPHQTTAADLKPLRALGLNDLEILDITHATAMFAWANRLLQTLGEVVRV